MNFKDSEFMSAELKSKVLKNFESFLNSDLDKKKFTKILYEHLHLHMGFIAHYDIHGFYQERFEDLDGFIMTHQIMNNSYIHSDYSDLNPKIIDLLNSHAERLVNILKAKAIKEEKERHEKRMSKLS